MANREIIEAPVEGRLGPAMLALNERQRRFVTAMLELGDLNHSRCALAAGYTGDQRTIGVTAHRLAHDERVLAAVHEESVRRLHSGKIMAVSTLLTLARGAPKDSDKLKAIEMVLNRTGMHATSEQKITVTNTSETDAAMIARIKELAGQMGLDERKLLGSAGVVDADFTVVENGDGSDADDLSDIMGDTDEAV